MMKMTKLSAILGPTSRMRQLLKQHLCLEAPSAEADYQTENFWLSLSAEGLVFGPPHDYCEEKPALELVWLAALADFTRKKKFQPAALFQLGAREIESYLREQNHIPAFSLVDEHDHFHYSLQEILAYLLCKRALAQNGDFEEDFWENKYPAQAMLLKEQVVLPLKTLLSSCVEMEWVYYGKKDEELVMVWNFQWSGPSELWTESTRAAFQRGFFRAGENFCRLSFDLSPLKWVAELDQLP